MNSKQLVALVGILAVFSVQCRAQQLEEEGEDSAQLLSREKRGHYKLGKYALRALARNLRNNRSVARRALNWLSEFFTGSRKSAYDIARVVDEVADRLDGFESATCQYFVDAAASLGLSRGFGHAVCQVALMLL